MCCEQQVAITKRNKHVLFFILFILLILSGTVNSMPGYAKIGLVYYPDGVQPVLKGALSISGQVEKQVIYSPFPVNALNTSYTSAFFIYI